MSLFDIYATQTPAGIPEIEPILKDADNLLANPSGYIPGERVAIFNRLAKARDQILVPKGSSYQPLIEAIDQAMPRV